MINDAVDRTSLLICEQASHTTWGKGLCNDSNDLTESGKSVAAFVAISCLVMVLLTMFVYPTVLSVVMAVIAFVVRDTPYVSAAFGCFSAILLLKTVLHGTVRSPQASETVCNGVLTVFVIALISGGTFLASGDVMISLIAAILSAAFSTTAVVYRHHSSLAAPGSVILTLSVILFIAVGSHQGYTINHFKCKYHLTRSVDVHECVEAAILQERLRAKQDGFLLSDSEKSKVEILIAEASGLDKFLSRAEVNESPTKWTVSSSSVPGTLFTIWRNTLSDFFSIRANMGPYARAISRSLGIFIVFSVMYGLLADTVFAALTRVEMDHNAEAFKTAMMKQLSTLFLLQYVPWFSMGVICPICLLFLGFLSDGLSANFPSVIACFVVVIYATYTFKSHMVIYIGAASTSRSVVSKSYIPERAISEVSRHRAVVVQASTALFILTFAGFCDWMTNGPGIVACVHTISALCVACYFHFALSAGEGLDIITLNRMLFVFTFLACDPLVIVNVAFALFSGGCRQLYKGLKASDPVSVGETDRT